jgi:hypothetical protein
MHPYKQQGQWEDVFDTMTRLLIRMLEKYHKTACTSVPEDEHLDAQNMSKTL